MESIKELKIKCQEKKRNKDFLLMKGYLWHREISIYITRFLLIVYPKIKPNSVSFTMIVISMAGCLMLLYNDVFLQIFGIFLIYLGFLLDKVDGEIARYKKHYSLRGAYLDELYHLLIPSLLFVCFFSFVFYEISFLGAILFLAVLLTIFNRYNRKIALIIFVKLNNKIRQNAFINSPNNKLINKLFKSFLFKIFSLVERFDLIIFSLLLVVLIEKYLTIPLRTYYLSVYLIFSLMYFIRWIMLYYFGGLEKEINNLKERGY